MSSTKPRKVFGFFAPKRAPFDSEFFKGKGNASPIIPPSLQEIDVPGRVVSLAAGDGFNAFICDDGSLWMSGDNASGQCGSGQGDIPRQSPVKVDLPCECVSASLGMRFTIAQLKDGTAVAFGGNDYRQLGKSAKKGAADQVLQPIEGSTSVRQVTGHIGFNPAESYLPKEALLDGVRSVACGLHLGFVVTTSGRVYAAGHKGYGLTEPGETPADIGYWTFTERMTLLKNLRVPVVAVAARYRTAYALTEDGRVVQWGKAQGGASGWGFEEDKPAEFVVPTVRDDLSAIEQISMLGMFCLALQRTSDGSTVVWKCGLTLPAEKVSGSEGTEVIDGVYSLRNGVIYKNFVPDEELVAPEGTRVVAIGGDQMFVVEPIGDDF